MLALFYVSFSSRIGRGVMLGSALVAYGGALAHHLSLVHRWKGVKERVGMIVGSSFDEAETGLIEAFSNPQIELAGVIGHAGYEPKGKLRVLGTTNNLVSLPRQERLDRIICTNKTINDPSLCHVFWRLRYTGVTVMPLSSLCEEVHQYIPLELITTEWLMNASGSPHVLYIKKIKRGFDIVVSLLGLTLFSPLLLFGILAVKLTSRGPAFYLQVRSGRFGKPFRLIKLRTMKLNAEENGAVWCREKDPRVTLVGRFLRKFRIDELPQLVNVLRGEMSFVGPRPERPEFVEELAEQIPFYWERFVVQPGITGWAQVNYPYGSSVEDTKRKLEYDLYYTKHMGLYLDIFSILDTLRIVLRGGLSTKRRTTRPSDTAILEVGHLNGNGRASSSDLPAKVPVAD